MDNLASARRRRRALWRMPYICRLIAKQPKLPALDETLPQDPRLTVGTLPCGVRYLIYTNRKPRLRAVLRLVVRVGSVAEADDQRGIAHLVEHMVFRGTPSFPAGDLKRFVERCGMSWGADLNAETSHEHTTYTFEVPLKNPASSNAAAHVASKKASSKVPALSSKLMETGLRVLREFAFEALMRPDDIKVEKGIVEEEWRGRLGAGQRVADRFWMTAFKGCRHACRLPIGCMDTLRRCPDDRVRAFYETWYRPENMSIVLAGDFPSNSYALKLLEDAFRGAAPCASPSPLGPLDATLRVVPRTAVVHIDEELTGCKIRLSVFSTTAPQITPRDVAEELAWDLLLMAANRRLTALQGREGAPFLGAMVDEQEYSQTYRCITFTATALEGKVQDATKALAEVAACLACYGLSARELQLVKKMHNTALDSAWAERHHAETEDVVEAIEEHVLSGEMSRLCTDTMDVRLQRAALEFIGDGADGDGVCYLQEAAGQFFGLQNGSWAVEAEVFGESEVDEDVLRAIVLAAAEANGTSRFEFEANETLTALTAFDEEDSSLADIVEKIPLEHFDASHWVLSNGATVTWMRTDFEPDEIMIHGMAVGGTSELELPAQRAAASALGAMTRLCGLGNLTRSQLGEHLVGKIASMSPCVSGYSRSLSGQSGSSPKDFEAALRLAAWHFLTPTFTQANFVKVLSACRETISNRAREPEHHLQKKLQELIFGIDPFFQDMSPEDVDGMERIGLEGLRQLYVDHFSNLGEWSWVIVGALPEEPAFSDLVVRFLGAEVKMERPLRCKPTPRRPLFTPGRHVTIYRGVSESATVCLCFKIQSESLLRASERLAAQWIAEVLEARLLDRLRISEGATYAVSCGVTSGAFELRCPDRSPMASIDFGCEPSAVERCTAMVYDEVEALTGGWKPVTHDEVESCREREREQMRVAERENSRWLGRLGLAVRRVRCGSVDEGGGVVPEPPASKADAHAPQLLVHSDQLLAMLSIPAQRAQRVEALQAATLQEISVHLFQKESSVSATLLPARAEEQQSKTQEQSKTQDQEAKRQRLS